MNKKQVISLAIIAFLVGAALLYASNGVGFDGTYSLTDAQKEEIDKLFEKSDIIALGTLETGEKPSLSSFAMHIEEILKLSPEFEEKRKDILENPISAFSFSYPSNTPNYFTRENIGKPFLLYGSFSISEKFPNGSSVAHKAYPMARQEDIENAKADIIFLGKRNLSFSSLPDHWRFRTATFDVLKITNKQEKLPLVTIRYKYTGEAYRMVPVNISDVEKLYWIAADKIPDTDHYDGEVIGAELSADIAYLRQK